MQNPDTLQLAFAHFNAGRLDQAEALLREVLVASPRSDGALYALGLVCARRGQWDQACGLVEQAVAAAPGNLTYRANLVALTAQRGRPGDVQRALEMARDLVARAPDDLGARESLAQASHAAGRYIDAATAWQWIANHGQTNNPAVIYQIGLNLMLAGRDEPATRALRDALALDPQRPDPVLPLAQLLARSGHVSDAIALLRDAMNKHPGLPEPRAELARLLCREGMVSQAEALLRELVAAPQGDRWAFEHGSALAANGRVDEAMQAYRRYCDAFPQDERACSTMLMTSLYVYPDDPAATLELHRRFERSILKNIAPMPPRPGATDPARRVRIGYLSGDFCEHSVSLFLDPLFAGHDRSRVEVHAFNTIPPKDRMTKTLMDSVERWHQVHTLSADQIAELVRREQIDILIDLAGHTAFNGLRVMAYRPAPMQVTYLGYSASTGLSCIDYRITDAIADPPGRTESFHSERLLRLPDSFAPFKPPRQMIDLEPLARVDDGVIRCACVQGIMKVNRGVCAAWAAAMRAAPRIRLVLVGNGFADPAVQARLLGMLEGVDPARVEFLGKQSFEDYIRLHARVDLALDTFPFNGHTTTLQNLWLGVPVVTCAGISHRSRMTASVLNCIGLNELVADSEDQYVQTIVSLAGDPSRLAALRSGLRARMLAAPLCDTKRFTRDFETLLLDAWSRHVPKS